MDEDIDGIFADYEAIRNEGRDAGDANNEQADADETESSQAVAAAIRKRIVRNPRPKLNAERLCGERGIPSLEKHFENVHFKEGKGNEKENLDKLMANLEHWAHRLFPSLKFSESLTHIEKLGRKKPVQVCKQKLRLGMPILSEDFVHEAEDDIDDVQRQSEMEPNDPPESTFDQLMREHRETFPETAVVTEDHTVTPSLPVASGWDAPLSAPKPTDQEQELTEEQKQRIERNKMLAAERRKTKLVATSTSLTSDASHSICSPPKVFSNDSLPDTETVHHSSPTCVEPFLTCDGTEVSVANPESAYV